MIFKRRSIHQFKGSSFDDFRMEEIDSKVGCVGPRAAVVDNNMIYMVSEQGADAVQRASQREPY